MVVKVFIFLYLEIITKRMLSTNLTSLLSLSFKKFTVKVFISNLDCRKVKCKRLAIFTGKFTKEIKFTITQSNKFETFLLVMRDSSFEQNRIGPKLSVEKGHVAVD